jgi:hypothetical protein
MKSFAFARRVHKVHFAAICEYSTYGLSRLSTHLNKQHKEQRDNTPKIAIIARIFERGTSSSNSPLLIPAEPCWLQMSIAPTWVTTVAGLPNIVMDTSSFLSAPLPDGACELMLIRQEGHWVWTVEFIIWMSRGPRDWDLYCALRRREQHLNLYTACQHRQSIIFRSQQLWRDGKENVVGRAYAKTHQNDGKQAEVLRVGGLDWNASMYKNGNEMNWKFVLWYNFFVCAKI